jgi:hydrogenase assembly chaperone HypC/HupF
MCLETICRVLELPEGEGSVAIVAVDGERRSVSLALLILQNVAVAPGDWLLAHTGLAIRVLDEDAARRHRDLRVEMRTAADDAS